MNPSLIRRGRPVLILAACGFSSYLAASALNEHLATDSATASASTVNIAESGVAPEGACPYPPEAPAADGAPPVVPEQAPMIRLKPASPIRPAIYYEPSWGDGNSNSPKLIV